MAQIERGEARIQRRISIKKALDTKVSLLSFLLYFLLLGRGDAGPVCCRTPVLQVCECILGMVLASLHNTQQFLPITFPSHGSAVMTALAMGYPGVCNSLLYSSTQFRVLCNKLHIVQALGRSTVPSGTVKHVTKNWRERGMGGEKGIEGWREREMWREG